MEVLRPLLPARYAPLQANGNGIQSIYLTDLSPSFAEVLAGIIGAEARSIIAGVSVGAVAPMQTNDDLDYWEHKIEAGIDADTSIPETDREAIIRARRGQGLFKQRVMVIENHCRITGVVNPVHLVASHCKPWRDCKNEERLDGENGLLLTPTIDHLFDRGFIGFENNGTLIVSPVAHQPSLDRMGVKTKQIVNVGGFTSGQQNFLEYHRNMVLLKAAR
jgi:putative restriction endonuclease